MSPDVYLQFAAGVISFFLKVAAACIICLFLARLLGSPRQRFAMWMSFLLGSLAYWFYEIAASLPFPRLAGTTHPASGIAGQFLVPAGFADAVAIAGELVVCAYLAGVLLLFSARVWKRIRLHALLKQAIPPSDEWKHLFDALCRQFGVHHCELLVLPKLSSPATVYWWRPRILLPKACDQLGDETLMDILYHEMAHVARRDFFWSSLSDVACCILFFHPAIWQARKEMRVQREMACDLAVVVARPEHRADYANTLTTVARLCLPRKFPVIGIDFAASASLLSDRVRAILSDPQKSSAGQKLARATAASMLVAAFALLFPAMAMVIAFAPSIQPPVAAEVQGMPEAHAQSNSRAKIRRERTTHATEQSAISESPAYRLQAAAPSRGYGSGASAGSEESSAAEVATTAVPAWKRPAAGTRPSGGTLESIIVGTVGTVIAADKDDRNKRKDSGHFQSSTNQPSSY